MSDKDKAREIAEEVCFNYHQADVCILHVEKAALIALELSEQRIEELEERIKKNPTSLISLICKGYLENEVDARELEVVMMKLRHRLLTTNNDSE